MTSPEEARRILFAPCPQCGRRLNPIPGCTAGLIADIADALRKQDMPRAVALLTENTDWTPELARGYLTCPHLIPATTGLCDRLREFNQSEEGLYPDLDRVMALWIVLDRERFTAVPGESLMERLATDPWRSGDARIREAWEALTASGNLAGLEKWASMELMNPTAREASRVALDYCRARAKSTS